MKICTNFHLVEGDDLKTLQGLRVEKPEYKPEVEVYKIGKYAIGSAGYLHAFIKGELWFIPISDSPKEDKMREVIDAHLESYDSIHSGYFETDNDIWLVELPKLLFQAQIISLSMASKKRFEVGHFRKGGIEARFRDSKDSLNLRTHRVDNYRYGVTISLIQDPDETKPIDITVRKHRLSELTTIAIPEEGLAVHIGGLKTVVSRYPITFEW